MVISDKVQLFFQVGQGEKGEVNVQKVLTAAEYCARILFSPQKIIQNYDRTLLL